MSTLNSPFHGDVKPAPTKSEKSYGNHYGVTQLNQPADGDVKTVFYDESESLKGAKPAKLETPFETDFRPGVGRS